MAIARYNVRRQQNGEYCVWDAKTHEPAEADSRRHINLQFDDAIDRAASLNRDRDSN